VAFDSARGTAAKDTNAEATENSTKDSMIERLIISWPRVTTVRLMMV
jgi:hypothetical protein